MLDEEQLAAELGLDGEGLEGLGAEISNEFGDDFGADFDLGDGGAPARDQGRRRELAFRAAGGRLVKKAVSSLSSLPEPPSPGAAHRRIRRLETAATLYRSGWATKGDGYGLGLYLKIEAIRGCIAPPWRPAQASSCSTCSSRIPTSDSVVHEQGRSRALARPGMAVLRQGVVDPGHRPMGAGVIGDCAQLPVGRAELGVLVEGQAGELSRQAQQVGQVVVGGLLPARGPDELEALPQPQQALPPAGRDQVQNAIYPGKSSLRREPEAGIRTG